ncbi:MAG: DUF421 domain-containing protein [Bdellovibrionales bacterium]|nr:DUF421 domain-containing protein [Bdellovibrionales bacterium]
MWQNLADFNLSPLNLIVRAVVVYLVVLILLRISGKRQLGQMGATEFVAILLISNAVQNSMNGGDNSLVGGLLLAAVLIGLSSLISYLTYRSVLFSTIFEGTPTLVIHNGKLIHKHLAQERMSESELRTLLRKQGLHNLQEIETAILEADGTLSVTRVS